MESNLSEFNAGSSHFDFGSLRNCNADQQYYEAEDEAAADEIKRDQEIHEAMKEFDESDDAYQAFDDSEGASFVSGNSFRVSNSHIVSQKPPQDYAPAEHSYTNTDLNSSNVQHGTHEKNYKAQNFSSGESAILPVHWDGNILPPVLPNSDSSTQGEKGSSQVHLTALQEEFNKLQLLYKLQSKQLEEVTKQSIELRKSSESDIKSLQLQLKKSEDTIKKFTSSCKHDQESISKLKQSKEFLASKVKELEFKFSTELTEKEQARQELESRTVTIRSLEQEIHALTQSESLSRLRQQQDNAIKEMKKKHEKEIVQLQDQIDSLNRKLYSKSIEAENLHTKLSELGKNFDVMQFEKAEMINNLTATLQASQLQCQQLLKTGGISEINLLKHQIKHLEEEKLQKEYGNDSLKKNLKDGDLKNSEASIPQYENQISSLGHEIEQLKDNLKEKSEHLKKVIASEYKQRENNESLQKQIITLMNEHHIDKEKSLAECREEYKRLHEAAVQRLREEQQAKYNKELAMTHAKYENKIRELAKEVKFLNDGLYESKSQYLKLSDENNALSMKLMHKDQVGVEKELKTENESKLSKFKKQLQEQCEEQLRKKVEEADKEIAARKKQIAERFAKWLEEAKATMQQNLNSDEEKLKNEYSNKSRQLEEQLQIEVLKYKTHYENEFSNARQEFNKKVSETGANKLEEMQEYFNKEMQLLKENFAHQKESWEKEKSEFIQKEFLLKEGLNVANESGKKLAEKVEKYKNKLVTMNTRHDEEVGQLLQKHSEQQKSLMEKQNEIALLKQNYKGISMHQNMTIQYTVDGTQTEDAVVLKKDAIKMKELAVAYMQKVIDNVNNHNRISRQKTKENIKCYLSRYRIQLISQVLDDIRDLRALPGRGTNGSHGDRASTTDSYLLRPPTSVRYNIFDHSDGRRAQKSDLRKAQQSDETTLDICNLPEPAIPYLYNFNLVQSQSQKSSSQKPATKKNIM